MTATAAPAPAQMPVDLPDLRLPDPPPPFADEGPPPAVASALRRLNRGMVPVVRAGLGAWMSTPLGGAILLLRVRGRRSGLVREAPLNYLVADGAVWILAGFGPRTQWYRNLQADRRVELLLPGRTVRGTATEARAEEVRRRIIPALVRSTPLPSLAAGMAVWRMSDDEILEETAFVPLLRVDPSDAVPIVPGPDDPGGRGWIWRQAMLTIATLLILAWAAGVARRLVRLSLRRDTPR